MLGHSSECLSFLPISPFSLLPGDSKRQEDQELLDRNSTPGFDLLPLTADGSQAALIQGLHLSFSREAETKLLPQISALWQRQREQMGPQVRPTAWQKVYTPPKYLLRTALLCSPGCMQARMPLSARCSTQHFKMVWEATLKSSSKARDQRKSVKPFPNSAASDASDCKR